MPAEKKIKPKDLSYDSSLPPFLQRLHDQKAGLGDQDRHERQIARPKRAKEHDDEDEPTVVDESGETVSKEELEKMNAAAGSGDDGVEEGGNVTGTLKGDGEPTASGALPDGDGKQRAETKVTDGTATKKRKVGKIVGDEGDENEAADAAQAAPTVKKGAKKVKKSKPIKLTFDDGDET